MTGQAHRVLVLGATGHFGGRIARALARDPGIDLYLGGRRRDALAALANALGLERERAVVTDLTATAIASTVDSHAIGVVIHTVGPFQRQPYDVAKGCIAGGAHYIDLADGREFVVEFGGALDQLARAANLLAITGASTLPALSSAVVDRYLAEFDRLDEIDIVIAPAQRTPRGEATVRGVLSYCGERFTWKQDGNWQGVYGWQSLRRVAVPKLGNRLAAACDVPDLQVLADRYPTVRTLQFRAALELSIQHIGLWLLAGVRRVWRGIPIDRVAPVFAAIGRGLDVFGGVRGGMTVTMCGSIKGRAATRLWYLVAEDNQGPEIPCLAAELLARKLARNVVPQRGAQACVGLLTLSDFEDAFATLPYRWGVLDESGASVPGSKRAGV